MNRVEDYEKMLGIKSLDSKPYHRNMSPLTMEGWIGLTFLVVLAILALFAIGTAAVFNPEAAAIMADQAQMQFEIEQLQKDQAALMLEISQTDLVPAATEISFPVITTYEIPDELLKVVALENSSCYEGALDVVTIVLNRLDSGRWGSSIYDVLSATFIDDKGTLQHEFSTFDFDGAYVINNAVRQACYDACSQGIRSAPSFVTDFRTKEAYDTDTWVQVNRTIYAERYGHVLLY